MDKQTLSGYGWIVIVTLILAVLLALATPFGTYVGNGVTTVVNGFINTNAETLSDDSIDSLSNKWEQKFENGVNNAVPTVYELKKQYDFTYYSTLEEAISTVNTGVATVDAVNEKDAEAGVYVDENGRVNVVLLKNIEVTEVIQIDSGIYFNLGGKTLTSNPTDNSKCTMKITSTDLVTIDGRLKGSKIIATNRKDINTNGIALFAGANAEILGLKFIMEENKETTTVVDGVALRAFYTFANTTLTMKDCDISIAGNKYIIHCVYAAGEFSALNSKFNIDGSSSIGGLVMNGKSEINNCEVNATNDKELPEDDENYIECIAVYNESKITNTTINIKSKDLYLSRGIGIGCENGENVLIEDCQINSNTGRAQQLIIKYTNMNANVNIKKCKLNSSLNGYSYTATGIVLTNGNGNTNIEDCTINMNNGTNYGIQIDGNACLKNCKINCLTGYIENTTENEFSVGIIVKENAIVTLIDCVAYGSGYGLSNKGQLYVEGGEYSGYMQGGFYFVDGVAYLEDVTAKHSELKGNYTSNQGSKDSAFYIGDTNGDSVDVYLNNCKLYGSRQPIVMYGAGDDENASLYISNTNIHTNDNAKIRIDRDSYKLYLGQGNNFNINLVNEARQSQVTETNEVYIKPE